MPGKPKAQTSRGGLPPLAIAAIALALALAAAAAWWACARAARRARPEEAEQEAGAEAEAGHAGGCSLPGTKAGGKHSCADNPGLDPVLEVSYNAQQMVKQSLLLEDHLNQPKKRCRDCICKHMMTLAALAEEAVSLSKTDADRRLMQEAAQFYDARYREWRAGASPTAVAERLRGMRKRIAARYLF